LVRIQPPLLKALKIQGFTFVEMFIVYALYSAKYDKIYIGYTSNIEQRLALHNSLSDKGYTTKYRPWIVVYQEQYSSKKEAMLREKQLKTAKGREFIRQQIQNNL
jgi:putative endonuclease